MKIIALDNTHVVLVHLKLEADRFETYRCERKLYVGINMLKLHMLIKTVGNSDMLTLFIDGDDPNHLGIRIENPEKNLRTTYKLAMLDINVVNINIPPADFETVITMPSADFQKIIRDMHNLADSIEISQVESQINFSCAGDFCTQQTIIGADKNQTIQINKSSQKDHAIVQGVYNLKYLSLFTRCTSLSSIVEIMLKNSFPLVLQYSVANLGSIRLALAENESS
jgi:proliferating cell nuclear antigen